MSSILYNSNSNISKRLNSNRLNSNEDCIPVKDLENLVLTQTQTNSAISTTTATNVVKCPNNFSLSNMNPHMYSSSAGGQATNIAGESRPNFYSSVNNPSQHHHQHDLPVIHAYNNNMANLMPKTYASNEHGHHLYASSSLNGGAGRYSHSTPPELVSAHFANSSGPHDRGSMYSNSSRLDSSSQMNNSGEIGNVNHLLVKRDNEIER